MRSIKPLAKRLALAEAQDARRRIDLRAASDAYRQATLKWIFDTGRIALVDGEYLARDVQFTRIAELLNTAKERRDNVEANHATV